MTITNQHDYVKTVLKRDPNLTRLFDTIPSVTIPFDDDGFRFLMFTIIGQQVSAHVANIIFNRLKLSLSVLNAQHVMNIPDQALREIGISFSKMSTMKRVAHYCLENNFHFNTFLDKKYTDLFIHIKGIGPWTMDMYNIFVLKDLNHFSYQDLGLIEGLKSVYKTPLKTIEEIKKVSQLWSPYKSIVAHFLWEYWDYYHKGKRKD